MVRRSLKVFTRNTTLHDSRNNCQHYPVIVLKISRVQHTLCPKPKTRACSNYQGPYIVLMFVLPAFLLLLPILGVYTAGSSHSNPCLASENLDTIRVFLGLGLGFRARAGAENARASCHTPICLSVSRQSGAIASFKHTCVYMYMYICNVYMHTYVPTETYIFTHVHILTHLHN